MLTWRCKVLLSTYSKDDQTIVLAGQNVPTFVVWTTLSKKLGDWFNPVLLERSCSVIFGIHPVSLQQSSQWFGPYQSLSIS